MVESEKNTYYAWMSDDDNETFGPDATQASATLASDNDATQTTVISDISKHANSGNTVDMDVTGSVTYTIQLKDGNAADTVDDDDVAKSGVEINVQFRRFTDKNDNNTINDDGTDTLTSINNKKLTTDSSGQATYIVSAPDSDSDDEEDSVLDEITVTSVLADPDALTIVWADEPPGAPNKAVAQIDSPNYAISYSSDNALVADVSATVTLYDMYGNTAGRTWQVDASISSVTGTTKTNEYVGRKGSVRLLWTKVTVGSNTTFVVDVGDVSDSNDANPLNPADVDETVANVTVHLVSKAMGRTTTDVDVAEVYADEDTFRGTDNNLYSYDSDDTFINADGEIIDMATFEEEAEGQGIDVLVYAEDGSIFRLKAATQ